MHIIAGKYKHKSIYTPSSGEFRPTLSRTREMVFNICQQEIEGASFLDLFAGTGAMGFEALSRGARKSVMVDSNRSAIEAMKRTVKSLGAEKDSEFLCLDVMKGLEYLRRKRASFDIVYIDPPYFKKEKEEEFQRVSEVLFFLDQEGCVLPNGIIFVEDSKDSPLGELLFTTLSLRSKRRCGDAFLWEFVKNQCKAALQT